MRSHFVAVGDQVGDLRPEVSEGVAEGPGPAACRHRKLARSYLAQCVQVAGIDRVLHQTPDKRLVLFGRH
jgi:hypothetical protein